METPTERDRLEQLLRGQQHLVEEVHLWLAEEQKHDDLLKAVVHSSDKEFLVNIPGLDPARIFHVDSIRALCVKFRLRFLPAGLFNGDIPPQALHAIRQLERRSDAPLTSFKVMAPAERFRLCDSEVDPLLFVPVGNDRYYLVHKWGNDLAWQRVILGWPFRSPATLAACVVLLAMVLTAIIPVQLITTDPQAGFWGAHRVLFLFWSIMVLASFTVFGWFAFFGQFSTQAWNSRYFNS